MKSAWRGGILSLADGTSCEGEEEEAPARSSPSLLPVPPPAPSPPPSLSARALLDLHHNQQQHQQQQNQQQPQHHHPTLSCSSALDELGFISGSEDNSPRSANEEDDEEGAGQGQGQQAFSAAAALAAAAFPRAAAAGNSMTRCSSSPGARTATSATPSPSAAFSHFEERTRSPPPPQHPHPHRSSLPPSFLPRASSSPSPSPLSSSSSPPSLSLSPPPPPPPPPPNFHDGSSSNLSISNDRPPSGPRRPGEGVAPVDAASQGILAAAPTPSGGARLAVSLLAAGFVIGPSGASVRDLCALTRADVRSWTDTPAVTAYRARMAARRERGGGGGGGGEGASYLEDELDSAAADEPALHPAFARIDRPVRVFTVEGAPEAVSAALEIIGAAVYRYVRLTDGSCAGRTVGRTQVLKGITFTYQPPPKAAVPGAAGLRSHLSPVSPPHSAGQDEGGDLQQQRQRRGAFPGGGRRGSVRVRARARSAAMAAAAASAPASAVLSKGTARVCGGGRDGCASDGGVLFGGRKRRRRNGC